MSEASARSRFTCSSRADRSTSARYFQITICVSIFCLSALAAHCLQLLDQIADSITGKQHLVCAPDHARRFQLRRRTFDDHEQLAVRVDRIENLPILDDVEVDDV